MELPSSQKVFPNKFPDDFSGHVIPYLTGNKLSKYFSGHVIGVFRVLPGFHPEK